jgi:hypothetical protein
MQHFVTSEHPSIVYLQETKKFVFNDFEVLQLLGVGFDYAFLPVV